MTGGWQAHLAEALAGAGLAAVAIADLEQALTHSSYGHEPGRDGRHNERLEFLGDAVLGLCVAETLFRQYPDLSPGEMTLLRASVVSREALAAVAAEWQLGDDLRLGRSEQLSGGRSRPSNLSRALEALIGAVYLSAGLAGARALVQRFLTERLESAADAPDESDPKTALQEWAQAKGLTPVYELTGRSGPDHAPVFMVRAMVQEVAAVGLGASRRAAERQAAQMLLAEVGALR